MKADAMRVAIAEACGWKKQLNNGAPEIDLDPYWEWAKDGYACKEEHLPDYLNDLNAMAEAEKTLTHHECEDYHQTLEYVQAEMTQERDGETEYPAQDFWFHASAPQRAEAFLRVKGLWQED